MSADDLVAAPDGPRCFWCSNAELLAYHDAEWGMPVADDRLLYEKLCLEGFQAGLSWLTVLRKRERFREVFEGFEPERVIRLGERDVARLMGDPGIIRHRLKITAAINNAHATLRVQAEVGSLAALVWRFEPPAASRPIQVTRATVQAAAQTAASHALAKELKRRGFTFVGATAVQSFMQAMGLVNDHQEACVVRARVEAARAGFVRPSAR